MQNKIKYRDIGIDFTPEDEELILQIHREMPVRTPEEEAIYVKELKETLEAAKHPKPFARILFRNFVYRGYERVALQSNFLYPRHLVIKKEIKFRFN